MATKLHRNDPCHCGSGKKYKNCCLEKDQSKLSSKLGVIGLVLVVILGIWLLAANFSSGNAQNCPAGTTWSEAHMHCH
ncbi:SEC-C metal-binding domain-containing protein [Gracilimonas tropica]|uniref:SEC-C metal-binding domain-containing protein n=1 Tax=Gracilimonas tropica TaxID=454600 RepID=UPI0008FBE773|nr:SEC-C metal-binding domain-containing protein [Gracilimonas tropica]